MQVKPRCVIDLDDAVIVDFEVIRQAAVGAARIMVEWSITRFDRNLQHHAYGSAEMLGWLAQERGVEPHIPVFDESRRSDRTFTRRLFWPQG